MRPEAAKLLTDISDAADRICAYTAGKSVEEYLSTSALRDAVHWNYAVIGEAMSQLYRLDPETAELIAEWRRIIAFRNQLIHGYGVVNNQITWDIVKTKLPVLQADVRRLLKS